MRLAEYRITRFQFARDRVIGDSQVRADAVNVAARLQDLTKTLNCAAIVSEEVCKTSGMAADALTRTEVSIRGRDQPMTVRMATDPTVLASLIDPQDALLDPEPQVA